MMGDPIQGFGDSTGTGPTAAQNIANYSLHALSVYVWGTFVGTTSIEVSPDGTNWVTAKDRANAALSGITAPGVFNLVGTAFQIRTNCTAYTSGTIKSAVISRG